MLDEDLRLASEALARALHAYNDAIRDYSELTHTLELSQQILRDLDKYGVKVEGRNVVQLIAQTEEDGQSGTATALAAAGDVSRLNEASSRPEASKPASALAALSGKPTSPSAAKPTPVETLGAFVDAFEREASAGNEYEPLTRSIMDDVDARLQRGMSTRDKKRAKTQPEPLELSLLGCIVRKLENGRAPEGHKLSDEDVQHHLAALRLIEQIHLIEGGAESRVADRVQEMQHRQEVFAY